MTNEQLELGLDETKPVAVPPPRESRMARAAWWFTQMRRMVSAAVFGGARLVKFLDGKIRLVGGSQDDCRAAREWCSLFLHEAAVACAG